MPDPRSAILDCLLVSALLLGSCGNSNPGEERGADRLPLRVVVIGPSTTETFFALGLGDRIVGVSDYCVEAGASQLPRVGGQLDPALERIAALAPDLVIVQGGHPRLQSWCQHTGVDFLPLKTDSWSAWIDEIRTLGERFGVPQAAADLIRESEEELALIRDRAARFQKRPATLIVVSRRPEETSGLIVAGASSFLSELLRVAGGRNIFEDNPGDYFDLNEESLLQSQPEVILELRPPDQDSLAVWRRGFPELPAVRDGKVYRLNEGFVLLPGPRMLETASLIQALLEKG